MVDYSIAIVYNHENLDIVDILLERTIIESSPSNISPLRLLETSLSQERVGELWTRDLPRAYRFWVNYGSGSHLFTNAEELNKFVDDRIEMLARYAGGVEPTALAKSTDGINNRDSVYQIRDRGVKLLSLVLNDSELKALGIRRSDDPETVRVSEIYSTYANLDDLIVRLTFDDSGLDTLIGRNPHFTILTGLLQEGYSLVQILDYFGITANTQSSLKNYHQGIRRTFINRELSDDLKVNYLSHMALGHFLLTDQDCRGKHPGNKVVSTLKKAAQGYYKSSRKEGPAMREFAIFARMLPFIHFSYLLDAGNPIMIRHPKIHGIQNGVFPGAKSNGKMDVDTTNIEEYYDQHVESVKLEEVRVPDALYFLAQDSVSGKTLDYMAYKIKSAGTPYSLKTIRASIGRGLVFFENMLLADHTFPDLCMEDQKEILRRNRRSEVHSIFKRIVRNLKKLSIPSSSSQPSHMS